jgi:hypothetical protein
MIPKGRRRKKKKKKKRRNTNAEVGASLTD